MNKIPPPQNNITILKGVCVWGGGKADAARTHHHDELDLVGAVAERLQLLHPVPCLEVRVVPEKHAESERAREKRERGREEREREREKRESEKRERGREQNQRESQRGCEPERDREKRERAR